MFASPTSLFHDHVCFTTKFVSCNVCFIVVFISPCLSRHVLPGVALPAGAGAPTVPFRQRCVGRLLLGAVLPVWRPKWEDPGCHRLWCLSQAGRAPHVSTVKQNPSSRTNCSICLFNLFFSQFKHLKIPLKSDFWYWILQNVFSH